MSGHFRAASLLSAWLLALFVSAAPAVLLTLAGIRMAASLVQSFLNIRLGRTQPLASTDRYDWGLMAAIFVAGEVVAALHQYQGVAFAGVALLPLLLPFSALQLRMCWRSYRAAVPRNTTETAIVRLEQFSRAERPAA